MVEGSLRIVKDDAGIWNRLTSEDAAIAVNQLNENARKHIMESGLKHQAEEKFPQTPPGRSRSAGRPFREGPLVLRHAHGVGGKHFQVRLLQEPAKLHEAQFPIPLFYLAKPVCVL